jgi:DNA-binding CsgD family transcriptional regulator
MLGLAYAAHRWPGLTPEANRVADWFLRHVPDDLVCYRDHRCPGRQGELPVRAGPVGPWQLLGPDRTRAAEERGAAMSLATAAEYALMLAAAEMGPLAADGSAADGAAAKGPGLDKLTPRERELVTLVARGHTDAQIAAQLCISVRTVRSHLDRIRDKTGYRRRADLTRLALAAGLV